MSKSCLPIYKPCQKNETAVYSQQSFLGIYIFIRSGKIYFGCMVSSFQSLSKLKGRLKPLRNFLVCYCFVMVTL